MEKTLVLIHTEDDGAAGKAAREVLSFARSLGSFDCAIIGTGAAEAANSLGGCGAERFFVVSSAACQSPRSSTDSAAAEALIRLSGAQVVLAPHTSRSLRSLPLVAERLNGAIDTHITSLATDGTITRWFYRQRIEGAYVRPQRPWIVLLEGGIAPAYEGEAVPVAATDVPIEKTSRTEPVGLEVPPLDRQTIRPDARLLFVAGAGWTKKQKDGQPHIEEAAGLIQAFVAKAPCSLGSSKSLVDQSTEGESVLPFLTHMHQVGQTGSTPRHPLGLATCCHGEEPHVVGWRFIGERRAVNLDPACGWSRGKADVLYVADAFEVVKELNERL
jgi:electron transfer flavoprotein alpha subunit